MQPESPRSVTLPPPIIPETEDSIVSPASEASSGYMSTSISTATLSDVYTLSWDLPPTSGYRTDSVESGPNEDGHEASENLTHLYETAQSDTVFWSLEADQSEPHVYLQDLNSSAAAESSDLPQPNMNDTPSDLLLSQHESNQSLSVKLTEAEEPNPVTQPELQGQKETKQVSTTEHDGSEPLDSLEPLKDPSLVPENETKQIESQPTNNSELETAITEEFSQAATDGTESQQPICDEPQALETTGPQPEQPEQDQTASEAQDPAPHLIPGFTLSAPVPSGDCVEERARSETPESNGSPIPASSSSSKDEVHVEEPVDTYTTPPSSLSSVQPSKPPASVVNPFKIQKVQSSDLKSFQRILGEQDGNLGEMGRTSSTGSGLNLSVPMETLEIISDSEEGEASAITVLPDWLKEGEFVTVGTNKSGTVRYVGPTDFADGTWIGVELEVPAGE